MVLTPYQRARQVALGCLDRTYDTDRDATYEDFMADLSLEASRELPGGAARAELAGRLLTWWDQLTDEERALLGVGTDNLDD